MKRVLFLLKARPLALIGILVVIFWILAAVFGPGLVPFTYSQLDTDYQMTAPGQGGHLLGTDALGRDILARVLTGSRSILTVALLTSLFSTLAGVILGFSAGYFGGRHPGGFYDRESDHHGIHRLYPGYRPGC
jgi:ABC-type dipeptide/oligopeptide/nickel transport system permease subunit